ncbi:hypothetical protein Aph02nite_72600 [Actinoplanes philippinensis]|uniref:Uncharacterized protein n=1 Tax=Actinoplanes philippinensis TaxID=35752 RepID=A0A1I2JWG6_9ACTN|nr:hypothetical protein [Actinoplanes philippinensis]GIE81310.1 hypothetical protein Aph02nite_72600 [Actinoplanes philippinensis]SFF58473.1 hypothetical protein SAMN05421541_11451 [Actinoplanes philippinensis]
MKQLSDLLREAKANPPAARYGVDQVVAAGRRRRRRRNGGWAVAAAVAVAVMIGVPQVITRAGGRPPVPAAPAPVTTYTFRGYTVDGYVVKDPFILDVGAVVAGVGRSGAGEKSSVGSLTVYRPGVAPEHPLTGLAAAEPMAGRTAFYRTVDHQKILTWEYAAEAYAELATPEGEVSKADAYRIASRLVMGGGAEPRIALRVGYVPDGYRVMETWSSPGEVTRFVRSMTNIMLAPAASQKALLTNPGRMFNRNGSAPEGEQRFHDQLVIGLYPAGRTREQMPPEPCDEKSCMRVLDDDVSMLIVGGDLPIEEIRKVYESVTVVSDFTDDAGWYPLSAAVPPSARLVVE